MTTHYDIDAGHIRKLGDDGQTVLATYPISEPIPTDVLRAYLRSYDAQGKDGNYDAMCREDMLKVFLDWYEQDLSIELKCYCDGYGLPQLSADELILEVTGDPLASQHAAWLTDFSVRWDEMTDLYHVIERG